MALVLLAGLAVLVLGPDPDRSVPVAGQGATATASAPSPSPAATEPSPTAAAGVRELLRRRARAILDRDRAAFAASLDPRADPGFRAAQLAMFDNLDGVPLAHLQYAVDPDDPAPNPPRVADPNADETWAPATEQRYALAGADTEPTTRPAGYLYLRRGADWYLASDTALDAVGRTTWRGPWDFGPCLAVRVSGGLVIGHPGAEQLVRRLAAELDAAVAAVSSVWGTGWAQRVGVLVPGTPAELRALVGDRSTNAAIAAVAVADQVDRAAGRARGQRVVFNPDSDALLGPTALRVVLRHELTHVAARAATDDHTPLWLQEGLAEYVAYRDSGLSPAVIAPGLTAAVPADYPGRCRRTRCSRAPDRTWPTSSRGASCVTWPPGSAPTGWSRCTAGWPPIPAPQPNPGSTAPCARCWAPTWPGCSPRGTATSNGPESWLKGSPRPGPGQEPLRDPARTRPGPGSVRGVRAG
ncbi:MAG: hypothetical protein QOG96_4813 [Pseudonocardiales bacterium]|nr:hypothetical protein [Pseudonocardiales bacterium]